MMIITIEQTLLTTPLPVAVYNDSGTYKLWTPSLLPTEPDGLLVARNEDGTGELSTDTATVPTEEIHEWYLPFWGCSVTSGGDVIPYQSATSDTDYAPSFGIPVPTGIQLDMTGYTYADLSDTTIFDGVNPDGDTCRDLAEYIDGTTWPIAFCNQDFLDIYMNPAYRDRISFFLKGTTDTRGVATEGTVFSLRIYENIQVMLSENSITAGSSITVDWLPIVAHPRLKIQIDGVDAVRDIDSADLSVALDTSGLVAGSYEISLIAMDHSKLSDSETLVVS